MLHVKPRTEKKVDDFLSCLRVFHYLPLLRKETKVQRRRVVRELPIFPGYVFARLFPDERLRVLDTKQIVQMVEVGNPRQMVHQLHQVAHAIRLTEDLRIAETYEPGDSVRVVSGPLRGLEGLVRRKDGVASLVLTVDILGRALETSVLQSDLAKM